MNVSSDTVRTVGLLSLGCAKNLVDSENLLGQLTQRGLRIVNDPAEADVLFVNTCGFIESAKQESIDAIFEMAQYKTQGRCKKLFVTGCLAQRYPDALLSEIPEIDGIMGVSDYARLDQMLSDANDGLRPCYIQDGPRFLKTPRVLTNAGYTAYVKISDGCNNRCTFCAIPLIRGAYASRPFDDIVEECRTLAKKGVTEITLIAQDTSRYGSDFGDGHFLLPELLEAVSAIDEVHWVRVLYCYPDSSDDRLLDAIERLPKVAKYLDLPLQHIDDALLKRMNRRGDAALIRDRIRACRERGILVRTTMIVGFPGETDAQFEELADFVRETRFDRLGAFTYSAEEGTPAARMPDQVDEDVKQARLDQLMMLQQGISMELNQKRVGTVCEVLVDGRDEEHGLYGRSLMEAPESDGIIWLKSDRPLEPGTYVRAKITDADAYDLVAEVIG
ncbi:MAG: 30S ribosomal protein S12 methylthiotransferase RimO [Clostridiales bacterium]|nr:30S ribosomal protein S12 methylthiotransferase RimO [Clostridiales bacterium]